MSDMYGCVIYNVEIHIMCSDSILPTGSLRHRYDDSYYRRFTRRGDSRRLRERHTHRAKVREALEHVRQGTRFSTDSKWLRMIALCNAINEYRKGMKGNGYLHNRRDALARFRLHIR